MRFIILNIFSLANILLQGWAIFLTWDWFILPVFESAPTLSFGAAIGLSFVFVALKGFAISTYDVEKATEEGEVARDENFKINMTKYVFYWIGWLYLIGLAWLFQFMIYG